MNRQDAFNCFRNPIFLFLFLLMGAGHLFGQEQIGLRVSNYSGVHGLGLNPASFTTNEGNLSVNLAGGYGFLENNYAFLKDETAFSLLGKGGDLALVQQIDIDEEGRKVGPNDAVVDYYGRVRKRYLELAGGILGPSFVFKTNSGHQVGLTTAVRAHFGTNNVPGPFSYYTYYNQPFFQPFRVDPFDLGAAAWLEIGFNYAYHFETSAGKAGIGATFKWLQGMEGVVFENLVPFDFTKLPGDSISGSVVDMRYGFTLSGMNGGVSPLFKGSGGALDLGFVYAAYGNRESYDWRLGVSLLDIGAIRFRKGAEAHRTRLKEFPSFIPGGNYNFISGELNDVEATVRAFSFDVLGDSLASLSGDNFQVYLPMGASIQLDVALSDQFFVNGLWVQGIPFGDPGIRRGSLLALTPRFESRWFEVALPVSLYNYDKFHVGLAGRVGILTLGSENLAGFLLPSANLSGVDFYFALHVPFFQVEGAGGPRLRARGGRKGRVRCYSF